MQHYLVGPLTKIESCLVTTGGVLFMVTSIPCPRTRPCAANSRRAATSLLRNRDPSRAGHSRNLLRRTPHICLRRPRHICRTAKWAAHYAPPRLASWWFLRLGRRNRLLILCSYRSRTRVGYRRHSGKRLRPSGGPC